MHSQDISPSVVAQAYILPLEFPAICQDWVHKYLYKEHTLHYHECLEIGLCTQGNGLEMINNHIYTFHSESITVIQKGCIHDSYVFKLTEEDSYCNWQFIFLDLDFFGLSCREFGGFLSDNPQLVTLFHMMYDELKEKRNDYKSVFSKLLAVFLSYVDRIAPYSVPMLSNTLSPAMSHALQYIYSNIETVNIAQLSKECNMSASTFFREFKSTFNQAPLAYINEVRFTSAKHLLLTTNMPILDISIEVGFKTLSSFNRLFKKQYGISPSQMRKESRISKD